MKIWVDADACPVAVKEILFKAAERTKSRLILVANRKIRIPKNKYIESRIVPSGIDVADNEIVAHVESEDLVITSDIPLAAKIVEKGAVGLNPRGEIYTADNVGEILSSRDFMDVLRSTGVETGGPSTLSKRDIQLFANSLDQILSRFGSR